VRSGEVTGLVGPNGAGKTTLFGVLSGLLRPNAGTVTWNGQDISAFRCQKRVSLGLVRTFQLPELYLNLTVAEHLRLAYRLKHRRSRLWSDLVDGRAWLNRTDPDENNSVDGILELLELQPHRDRVVEALPIALSRLVEVGRAVASDPRLLLLDEPSAGLDRDETKRLADAIASLVDQTGLGVLLVEHDVSFVMGVSRSVFVLDYGMIIAHGTPEVIRSDPAVQQAYLGTKAARPSA
jgi:branched-chain amino acid transport system ATP-binding protein